MDQSDKWIVLVGKPLSDITIKSRVQSLNDLLSVSLKFTLQQWTGITVMEKSNYISFDNHRLEKINRDCSSIINK